MCVFSAMCLCEGRCGVSFRAGAQAHSLVWQVAAGVCHPMPSVAPSALRHTPIRMRAVDRVRVHPWPLASPKQHKRDLSHGTCTHAPQITDVGAEDDSLHTATLDAAGGTGALPACIVGVSMLACGTQAGWHCDAVIGWRFYLVMSVRSALMPFLLGS